MRVGVPTEIKDHEFRVSLTPAGVKELTLAGHEVLIQQGAGHGSNFSDEDYVHAGAAIAPSAQEVWDGADLLLKVKEPIAAEFGLMHEGQVLFTYLHLAADQACTDAILASKTTAIAYETVTTHKGGLPLLSPMSEVAGRLATQVASYYLMKPNGGRGVLMGGIAGVEEARVAIIGAGVAGENAATMAMGLHADVTVIDVNLGRLEQLDNRYNGRIRTRASSTYEIAHQVAEADVVIGSVLIPGAQAPKLVTDEMIRNMQPGAVLVDIAIDQGGCFEHSRPTTHTDPTFRVHNSLFYCVANMPGAVPASSTRALTNATLPYILRLANKGWREALREDPWFAAGLNAHDGILTYKPVAEAFNYECAHTDTVIDG